MPCSPRSASCGAESPSEARDIRGSPRRGTLKVGSYATSGREPGQGGNAAALSGSRRVPWGCLAGVAVSRSARISCGRWRVHGHFLRSEGVRPRGARPARRAGGVGWRKSNSIRPCTGGTGRRRRRRSWAKITSCAPSPERSAKGACTTRSCSVVLAAPARPRPLASSPRWSTASRAPRRNPAACAPSAWPSVKARTWTWSRSTPPATVASKMPANFARRPPPRPCRAARRSTSSTRRSACPARRSTRC